MGMKEVKCAVIFLHRVEDDKDFTETVNCIPSERSKVLEAALLEMKDNGEIDTIQIGFYYKDEHPLSPLSDQVDEFLKKVRPHSSTNRASASEAEDSGLIPDEASNFTGFDDVPDQETNS